MGYVWMNWLLSLLLTVVGIFLLCLLSSFQRGFQRNVNVIVACCSVCRWISSFSKRKHAVTSCTSTTAIAPNLHLCRHWTARSTHRLVASSVLNAVCLYASRATPPTLTLVSRPLSPHRHQVWNRSFWHTDDCMMLPYGEDQLYISDCARRSAKRILYLGGGVQHREHYIVSF